MSELQPRFYRIKWGLLGEWWCVAEDLSPGEQDAMLDRARHDLMIQCPLDMVRDRMFGGFPCANGSDRRHVCYSTGHYCFSGDAQDRIGEGQRAEEWRKLLAANGEPPWLGGGPFAEGRPKEEEEA